MTGKKQQQEQKQNFPKKEKTKTRNRMNSVNQFEDSASRSRGKHKENPRTPYATGSAGLACIVRGSSRRIMIMRFRPANISLINRRHYLPRLLLTLSSNYNDKTTPAFADIDRSHHISDEWPTTRPGQSHLC